MFDVPVCKQRAIVRTWGNFTWPETREKQIQLKLFPYNFAATLISQLLKNSIHIRFAETLLSHQIMMNSIGNRKLNFLCPLNFSSLITHPFTCGTRSETELELSLHRLVFFWCKSDSNFSHLKSASRVKAMKKDCCQCGDISARNTIMSLSFEIKFSMENCVGGKKFAIAIYWQKWSGMLHSRLSLNQSLEIITWFHFSDFQADCWACCFRSMMFSSMESLGWKRFISDKMRST